MKDRASGLPSGRADLLHDILERALYDPTCGSGSLLIKALDEEPNGLIKTRG